MNSQEIASTTISSSLLCFLKRRLESPTLAFLEPPTLIGEGTGSQIFAFRLLNAPPGFDLPLVLRLLISRDESMQMDLEFIVQNSVANQGFPAPRVLLASKGGEELGRPFLIMTQVSNNHLTTAPRPIAGVLGAARRLLEFSCIIPNSLELRMEALAQLHSLDPTPLEKALHEQGINCQQLSAERQLEDVFSWIETWQLHPFRPLADWLLKHRPMPGRIAICHGDPHPMNILISKGKLAGMIDWEEARLAPPEFDIGVLCGHLRCVQLFPFPLGTWEQIFQQRLINKYLIAYERYRQLDYKLVKYYEMEFLVRVFVYIAIRQIHRNQGGLVAGNPIMDSPRTASLIQTFLQAETKLEVAYPFLVKS